MAMLGVGQNVEGNGYYLMNGANTDNTDLRLTPERVYGGTG